MTSKNTLEDIIKTKNLCISNNPLGIDRNWPKSYIKNFYNKFCYELYLNNKSPRILEINQKNYLNLYLWSQFFNDIKVDNLNIHEIRNFKNIKAQYDMIIISDPKLIYNFENIKDLMKILRKGGYLIIENIGCEINLINKIYFNYYFQNLNLMDFRLKRFLINNCIITIQNNSTTKKKLKKISNYLFFIFVETLIMILKKLKKLLKN